MRILFCGSRTFSNYQRVEATIRSIHAEFADLNEPFVCIHGDARGADTMAADACDALGFDEIIAYPADWKRYGKRAGYVRNQQMLDEGHPDLVVAFRSHGESRGTDMMCDLASKAGVMVRVVNP